MDKHAYILFGSLISLVILSLIALSIDNKPYIQVPLANNTVFTSPNKSEFRLFYADWCGYSKKFLPTWEKLTKDKQLNVAFKKYTDNDKEILKKYSIRGFPTLQLCTGVDSNGEYTNCRIYNGSRDYESIKQFIINNK
ncbi:MAG: hypothetical protein CMG46_01885 [Candidatus Marinimicrobia bacterium]|nr:hypothetical protein [Candidatus Neomarinimicrobiota bacterium]